MSFWDSSFTIMRWCTRCSTKRSIARLNAVPRSTTNSRLRSAECRVRIPCFPCLPKKGGENFIIIIVIITKNNYLLDDAKERSLLSLPDSLPERVRRLPWGPLRWLHPEGILRRQAPPHMKPLCISNWIGRYIELFNSYFVVNHCFKHIAHDRRLINGDQAGFFAKQATNGLCAQPAHVGVRPHEPHNVRLKKEINNSIIRVYIVLRRLYSKCCVPVR